MFVDPNHVVAYNPQVDVATADDDDPDNYMILVPAKDRKKPLLQMCCATIAWLMVLCAVIFDEMSDGDVEFVDPLTSDEFLQEVDYDCGWRSFRVNYIYDEEDMQGDGNKHVAYERFIYRYDGSFCEDYDEVVDPGFCHRSKTNGQIWLAMSILGLVFLAASLPAVWYQGKASIIYVAFLSLACLFLSIGSLNWLFNDKCQDIEQWPQEDVTFDTTLGVSMILMFIAVFCTIIGLLISSVHLTAPAQKRRQQERLQKQQPRIQSSVVVN